MDLSPRVRAAIERYFQPAEQAEVAGMLSELGENASPDGAERLQLIILRISYQDVKRVRVLMDMAKHDYRDVIVAESHPNRTYIVGLLRKGPDATSEFVSLKLASLEAWKKAGAIIIGGQCVNDEALRGLYIFKVDSIEAAQALVSSDPAIQSGRLQFEFHRWLTADGLQVGAPKEFLDV